MRPYRRERRFAGPLNLQAPHSEDTPASRLILQPSLPAARPQPYRRTLQLLQQLSRIILVNPILYQRLCHITNRPLHGLQVHQRRQRVLLAPAPLSVRLLLMFVAPGLRPSSPALCTAAHSCGTSGTADSSSTVLPVFGSVRRLGYWFSCLANC